VRNQGAAAAPSRDRTGECGDAAGALRLFQALLPDQVPARGTFRPGWLSAPQGPAEPPPPALAPPSGTDLYRQRVAASGLSTRELGDLAGIHPHLLSGPALGGQPARALAELARALQMHPADLYPGLAGVTGHPRHRDADPGAAPGVREDALALLTALAYARAPLAAGDLAAALDWPLHRVTAALGRAREDPGLGGPMMLRRVPPHAWALSPRPGTLSPRQQDAITSAARAAQLLTGEQATVLLAALAFGQTPRYASFREAHPHAEHTLKETGLLRSAAGPHRAAVSSDVRFSLRHADDRHLAAVRCYQAARAPGNSGSRPGAGDSAGITAPAAPHGRPAADINSARAADNIPASPLSLIRRSTPVTFTWRTTPAANALTRSSLII